MRKPGRSVLTLLAVLVLLAAGLGWRRLGRRSRSGSAVVAGEALARDLGCFACHGAGGTQPIANPGATDRTVPSWGGGNWMMYNDSPEDIREWILFGRLEGHEPAGNPLLPMPAYEKWLDEEQLDNLTAYVLAVSQFGWPEEPVATGREIAVRFGCFSCHGPEGRGGVANPGSFKGYIPGWDGPDYLELVPDRAAFDEWVTAGVSAKIAANPAARFFLDRQAIDMPAYGDHLSDGEVAALFAYVSWVREHPRS